MEELPLLINPSFLAIKDKTKIVEKAMAALQAQLSLGVVTPWLHYDIIKAGKSGQATMIIKVNNPEQTIDILTPEILRDIKEAAKKEGIKFNLDVHLMVMDPTEEFINSYIEAGADFVTLHWEGFKYPGDLANRLRFIKQQGVKVGLAFNPDVEIERVGEFVTEYNLKNEIDLYLQMSVYPGRGGQKFITKTLNNIRWLRANFPAPVLIEVDGGIEPTIWARLAAKAGANILVAGSSFFGKDRQEQAGFEQALRRLNDAIKGGLAEIKKSGQDKLNEKEFSKYYSALKAVEIVRNLTKSVNKPLIVGLGSGTTAWDYFLPLLGEAISTGKIDSKDIIGISSSPKTKIIAQDYNINMATLEDYPKIDIIVDGADEIDSKFFAIKGGGGALKE